MKQKRIWPLVAELTLIYILFGCDSKRPSNWITITHPQSEFTVTIRRTVTKPVAIAGSQETVTYYEACESLPYLNAEFINKTSTALMRSNFRATLENYAKVSGLSLIEITKYRDNLGTVGTYSGFKKLGNIGTVRVYGKWVLGEYTGIRCQIIENPEVFPSEESARFLDSIERK